MIALLLTLAAPTLSYQLSASIGVTPVQKVIAMMNEMKAKGTAEMEKEAKVFKEYMSWCDVMKDEKETAIREATDQIAKLHAHEMKMHADAEKLGDQVVELDTEIATFSGDKKENKDIRTVEHDDYVHVHDDTTANIDATHQAIAKLSAKSGDVAAFLQEDVNTVPMTSKQFVQSLLEENAVQPQATVKAFEGSSGGILKTMEDMEGDLSESREKSEYEESDERHAYDMEQDELSQAIEVDDDRATDKTVEKSEKKGVEAHDHGDLVALSNQKSEDEKYLAELLAQCESKSNDFESRQKLRSEELDALQEAIDLIDSKSVSGAADKHLPGFVQTQRSLALRASASAQTKAKASVVRALQQAAAQQKSKHLARLAARVMEAGPFDKIIGMIKDMIAKLTETAGAEADHKEFCDGELKENKMTRDSKTSDINSLTATKERLEAQIAKLTEERAALSNAIAELDAAMSEATSIRQKESNENTDAIKDAKEAQEAVKAALGVLEGFYAKAASATAFTQSRGPAHDAPESYTEPYKGMGGGTGVIGMLEVILSDFVRLDQETSSEEAAAQAAFDEFSSTSTADKDAKMEELETKRKQKVAAQADLAQTMRDLKSTQKELNAALKYFEKLKPSCLDAGVDYAERSARREEEIASLKDALKTLGEEA
jgi:peptidoglycan hydrolase CwlO-like protein